MFRIRIHISFWLLFLQWLTLWATSNPSQSQGAMIVDLCPGCEAHSKYGLGNLKFSYFLWIGHWSEYLIRFVPYTIRTFCATVTRTWKNRIFSSESVNTLVCTYFQLEVTVNQRFGRARVARACAVVLLKSWLSNKSLWTEFCSVGSIYFDWASKPPKTKINSVECFQ